MRISPKIHCFKPSAIGGIGYDLRLNGAEIAMLQLLLAQDDSILHYWKCFWDEILDYELAPFGCKELMPLAVRRMQQAVGQSAWKSYTPCNVAFLTGLPKYTWTKNRVILMECNKLAELLHLNGVEVMAIKGVAEMLRAPEIMLMRTSRDIDLLIQEKDLAVSVDLFNTLGWHSDQLIDGLPGPLSEFEGNSFTFTHPNHSFSLDIHFDVISDGRGEFGSFTAELWSNKELPSSKGLIYIPSAEDRFCLFLANAYVPDNWTTGLVNKYLYDLISQLKVMSSSERSSVALRAEKFLKLGYAAQQLICLEEQIRSTRWTPQRGLECISSQFISRISHGFKMCESRYYYFLHLHNHYRALKPKLDMKFGPLFVWPYILIHWAFYTRPIQVSYWRVVTIKDQFTERVLYYWRRVLFHTNKIFRDPVYALRKLRLIQMEKKISSKCESVIDSVIEGEEALSPSRDYLEADLSPKIDSVTILPLGMTRNFYLSPKLFRL